ncbi:MAG: hypothetical protein KDJ47_03380 [Hyphomicrobiaceae bacterium]|nr:hypothetical protein [Hyphomicrobiaceae bacterium]
MRDSHDESFTQRQPAGAPRKGASPNTALPDTVKRQVARFPVAARAPIRKLIRSKPQAAELVEAFPALLYALAMGHAGTASGQNALHQLDRGLRLRNIAQTLGVPMWMRRLPPETFESGLSKLPASDTFSRRIPARLPQHPAQAANWLQAVRFANSAAGDEFALWIARQRAACHKPNVSSRLAILAAFVWHSRHRTDRTCDLIWTSWRPEMALETAVCAAQSWFNRILATLYLSQPAALSPWLNPGRVDGYEFIPLTCAAELFMEARAMNNCTDQYAMTLVTGRSRLFSVRRDGRRQATLEISPHHRERQVLAIAQLKSHSNRPAPLEVWQAAYHWMGQQQHLFDGAIENGERRLVPDKDIWHSHLKAYRSATEGAPWLPADPTDRAMTTIQVGHATLAHDCAIRSWLFA